MGMQYTYCFFDSTEERLIHSIENENILFYVARAHRKRFTLSIICQCLDAWIRFNGSYCEMIRFYKKAVNTARTCACVLSFLTHVIKGCHLYFYPLIRFLIKTSPSGKHKIVQEVLSISLKKETAASNTVLFLLVT
jgi:hypothetical protein